MYHSDVICVIRADFDGECVKKLNLGRISGGLLDLRAVSAHDLGRKGWRGGEGGVKRCR